MSLNRYLKFFYELNDDLQDLILSKIIYTKDKKLLEDIRNYQVTKKKIFYIYLEKGYENDINNEFYVYFKIENDLIRYYNDNIPTMYGITENNIEKLERILSIKGKMEKKKEEVATNLMSRNKIDVNSRINILLGALKIEERNNFINLY